MILRPLALMALICTIVSCQPQPKPKASVAPVGSAKVVAPDRIFFKNIRATRYETKEDYENHMTTYTHSKLLEAPAGWRINLTDDWINDRAWLAFASEAPGLFYRLGAEDEEISIIDYKTYSDLETVKTFAQRLAAPYEICYREVSMLTATCLPAESPIRLALRETISDYLRLTDQD